MSIAEKRAAKPASAQLEEMTLVDVEEDNLVLLKHAGSPTTVPFKETAAEKREVISSLGVCCLTLFNFPYGCICTTMGMFVLPAEAIRLFPENESFALGCFLLSVGVSQLICPYVGLASDRCNSPLGRRRPFIIAGTVCALILVAVMQWCSQNYYKWGYGLALFGAMFSLNTVFSAQCGLVPDLVPESKQGLASGTVAAMQLGGSFVGFICVMISKDRDIHTAYPFYQALLAFCVLIICVFCPEVPDHPKPSPTWREIARSYTIDTTKDADFFWVFVSRAFFYAAVSCQAFMLYYIRDVIGTADTADARRQMATIALIGQFTAACVAYPVGQLSDLSQIGRKSLIYLACTVMCGVYLSFMIFPLALSRSYLISAVYIVASIYGVGNGCYLAVDYALALDVLPSKSTSGQDLGVWGIAAFLGSSIGPMVYGTVLKMVGKRGEGDEQYVVFFL
eukprot:TRINITY_DN8006_c0_g1_i2.p1 TRINITY_DN8006_c0_g1~~TRINITY_DN8006_c0_g1_i2.p1  ORF type:complete len:451 (+),score=41.69 TRINITY_DN8006_c0_g1_i2:88-1440(+)